MSTDRSDCRLSFAAPVGLLLSCNHIYSQYVFIDDAQEILQMMEKNSRNMLSLSKYSRSNAVNQEWTEMYLDEAHTKGVLPVRCHCNVIAWAEDAEEFRRIRNDTGSQLAMMECTPRYNTMTHRSSIGRESPEMQATFHPKNPFIPSWNRPYASLPERPITGTRPVRSASGWQTARTGYRCMWIFQTCP